MLARLALIAALLALPAAGFAGDGAAASDAVCVQNGSSRTLVFAAEARSGERRVARLAPGGRLCAQGAKAGARGMVSVYPSMNAVEGCSRLVPVGRTETLHRYVEFDRCFWGSNS